MWDPLRIFATAEASNFVSQIEKHIMMFMLQGVVSSDLSEDKVNRPSI